MAHSQKKIDFCQLMEAIADNNKKLISTIDRE